MVLLLSDRFLHLYLINLILIEPAPHRWVIGHLIMCMLLHQEDVFLLGQSRLLTRQHVYLLLHLSCLDICYLSFSPDLLNSLLDGLQLVSTLLLKCFFQLFLVNERLCLDLLGH